jgi:arylsulfatase A
MVAEMDRIVGRLVDAVDRLGIGEETLILFTTDNGSPARYLTDVEHRNGRIVRKHAPVVSVRRGEKIIGGKGKLTDAGTRVPLIARWPGVVSEHSVQGVALDFSDFFPTLAELAGAEMPQRLSLDGVSFVPLLRGEQTPHRPWVYSQSRNAREGRSWVRTARFKVYSDGAFFDMPTDPREREPITEEEATPEIEAARKRLTKAMEELRP